MSDPAATAPEVRARYSLMDMIKGNINVDEVGISTPTVTLFVRTDNLPAIRLYESIGMDRVGSYRSVLF